MILREVGARTLDVSEVAARLTFCGSI